MKKLLSIIVFTLLALEPAMSAPSGGGSGFNPDKLLFGGGISRNSVSGSDDGTGYQVFGGYRFGEVANNVKLDAEVGYMNTGNMEVGHPIIPNVRIDTKAKGLWANAVARLEVNPSIDLIGRGGIDFGDDDGFMFGIGVGFNANKQIQLRGEFVERDNVSSIQFNLAFFPK